MRFLPVLTLLGGCLFFSLVPHSEAAGETPPGGEPSLAWMTDYTKAMARAEAQGKMVFLLFCQPEEDPLCQRLLSETLSDSRVREKLKGYVRARLPLDASIIVDGQEMKILDHPAFSEMLGRPGIAMVDFAHKDEELHGSVVSTFPLIFGRPYTVREMLVMLDLPPGTLTQRTLIYAVRTHPDQPASADGQIDPHLLAEARDHSDYQARIRRQGHHRWNARFPRINALLPRGLTASEVCAESWPGEGLLAAAIECVRCWRLSSGHWSAVRARHRVYGYDMRRGANGIWYATGIFGRR